MLPSSSCPFGQCVGSTSTKPRSVFTNRTPSSFEHSFDILRAYDVLASDLRDDDMQPRTVRQHRIDKRRRKIDAVKMTERPPANVDRTTWGNRTPLIA
jgi:hypothetical protein